MKKQHKALVYHFYAHYRRPILEELLKNSAYEWTFYGDVKDIDAGGIEAWIPENSNRFVRTNCRRISGFLFQGGLIRLALDKNIDCIVYLGDWHFVATWISAILARLSGKRVLFWTHGWLRQESGLFFGVRNVFYRLAHGLLLYGHQAKMYGLMKGFNPESLYVIYNSLDYIKQSNIRKSITRDDIETTRRELFSDIDTPIVICSSRLTKSKQIDQLVQAASILKKTGNNINLLIVGDGPERNALTDLARQLDVNIHMFGPCYEENILGRLFLSSDITVIPGAAGLTIMHSLAYGIPVIVHNDSTKHGPEFEAIIPGVNGDTYNKDDIEALAQVILKWTEKNSDIDTQSKDSYKIIDMLYNPEKQRQIIDRAVNGLPADDIFWLKEHD